MNFKELQAKWYKKLANSGFQDIEQAEDRLLRTWHDSKFKQESPIEIATTVEYFNCALQLLDIYKFKSRKQRGIWEMHAQGHTERAIAKKKRCAKSTVHDTISALQLEIVKCK